jgi:uridylate kinase
MKKVVVLSLGGSIIFKDNQINIKLLKEFKKIVNKHTKNYKFIIVCGGGNVARMYISALREIGESETLQSFAGISVTRTNARFMSYFFGNDSEGGVPQSTETLKKLINQKDVIFCGALEYHPNQTSDSTAAQIATVFNADFINLTLVSGLHDKNPLVHKNAKFIPEITWPNFDKMASKIEFKPGQHFVLDQKASKIIMKNKIKTYILGKDLKNLDNLLSGKKFRGTTIHG